MVAHNLPFETGFLAAEHERMGVQPPLAGDHGFCMMRMAVDFLPGSQRSLAACCHAASVTLNDQHEALSDARAADGLLAYYLAQGGTPPPWDERARQVAAAGLARASTLQRRSGVPRPRGHGSGRLPRGADPVVDSYLAVLDEALLDRYISVEEADSLVAVAGQLGMDRSSALTAHRLYLAALVEAAWEDGELTPAELSDIHQVAALLGLSEFDVSQCERGSETTVTRFRLRAGDSVVFTGQMSEPREAFERRAAAAGLVVAAGVTKRTSLVVAADPDSLSGKARKACSYGIPVVAEGTFGTLIEEMS
jgi:DNA polymerase-3 subunit epsilon